MLEMVSIGIDYIDVIIIAITITIVTAMVVGSSRDGRRRREVYSGDKDMIISSFSGELASYPPNHPYQSKEWKESEEAARSDRICSRR